MNIYEHHEIKGWFFLPEDPDNRVPGVLEWDPAKGTFMFTASPVRGMMRRKACTGGGVL